MTKKKIESLPKIIEIPMSCGIDDSGRGAIFGNLTCCAVILDPDNPIEGLDDSKKLSQKKIKYLAQEIKEKALAFSIAEATVQEIEELNILNATMLAMQRAANGLKIKPQYAYVDGNRVPDALPCESEYVIKGDSRVESIMAASIVGKDYRDSQMIKLGKLYPGYGIEKHMGYPTKQHILANNELGITELHRKTFGPVKKLISKQINLI